MKDEEIMDRYNNPTKTQEQYQALVDDLKFYEQRLVHTDLQVEYFQKMLAIEKKAQESYQFKIEDLSLQIANFWESQDISNTIIEE